MSDPLNVPDGMALACQTCGWRPPVDLVMGVVAAHFETEHDTTDVRLDLIVLCPHCDLSMPFVYSRNGVDHFSCDECLRSRRVRRG